MKILKNVGITPTTKATMLENSRGKGNYPDNTLRVSDIVVLILTFILLIGILYFLTF